MQREGAQCNLPGYSKLKLPVTASYVTLYLTDRPPVRTDPLSVVIVTEPSWVMVYPLGTRVVEFTAYFDMAGHLVEDLPVRVQDFVVTTPRRVSTPPNARQVTGYLEDAQVQAFIQRL